MFPKKPSENPAYAATVALFDSATHPTLDGQWLTGSQDDASVATLRREMVAAHVRAAFALGMDRIGGYEFSRYASHLRETAPELLPVAWAPFERLRTPADAGRFARDARAAGYVGVKIHPRFADIALTDPRIDDVIAAATGEKLAIFLCTHLYDARHYRENTLENLGLLLQRNAASRIVLLHGGTVQLMELMQLAKIFRNTLVDVSYTLCKFAGSSLDLDLAWLFQTCDRRICVGSDHPEYRPALLRARFVQLAANLPQDQVDNIAFANLAAFTGCALPPVPATEEL